MSNPIHYLVALLIALAYPTGLEPLHFAQSPLVSLAAFGVILFGVSLLCATFYGRKTSPPLFRLFRTGIKILNLFLFAMLIFVFHFPLLIWDNLGFEMIPGIDAALVLAPFFCLMGSHALFAARGESRIRADGSTWKGHLIFGTRTFLAFSLFPILLLLCLQFVFVGIPAVEKLSIIYPFAAWGIALGVISLFLLLAPFYLKLAFGAPPLPKGAKRARLETLAEKSGFLYRDLLLINTSESRIANALIIGLLPHVRYVFFTSTLFHQMDEGELECVMAHEMSHGLKKHLVSYFLFTLGYLALATGLQEVLAELGVPVMVVSALFLLLFFAFWVLLFGYVSRRFETEADLYGADLLEYEAESMSKAGRLAQALHRVCALNGVHPAIGSWRHYSVSRRSMILLEAESNPGIKKKWEKTCSRLRMAGFAALAISFLYGINFTVRNLKRVPQATAEWEIYESASRGWKLLHEGKAEEAAPLLENSLRGSHAPGEIYLLLAEAYEELGRTREALESRRMAERVGVTDPRFRLQLEPTSQDR